ncbi:MAG TPA: AraC family transcriptional regulator [Lachnospiraceae bacterium]|nr:AraC family transcriptional regulator [Lachnospiraceae bacterium]
MVSLEEMKKYLRVDFDEDDGLIESFIASAYKICGDVARAETTEDFDNIENSKVAVMYTVSYLYEHREDANHQELMLTLRSLLFGSRKVVF